MNDLVLKARLHEADIEKAPLTLRGTGMKRDLIPGVAAARYGMREATAMKQQQRDARKGLKDVRREERKQGRAAKRAQNRQDLYDRTAMNPKLQAITNPRQTERALGKNPTPYDAAQYNLDQEAMTQRRNTPQLRPIRRMGADPQQQSGPEMPKNLPTAQDAAEMGLTGGSAPPRTARKIPLNTTESSTNSPSGPGTAPSVPLPPQSPPQEQASVPLPPPAPPAPPAPASTPPQQPSPQQPQQQPAPQQQQQQPQQQQQGYDKTKDPAYLAQVANASQKGKGKMGYNPLVAALTGGLSVPAQFIANKFGQRAGQQELSRLQRKSADLNDLQDLLAIRKSVQARNTTEVLRRGRY